MRIGIAHHLGWAAAVTASADHVVVDRRRLELVEPGHPTAPIHHEGGLHPLHRSGEPLDDDALEALVTRVRRSVVQATTAALDELVAELTGPITSISLRAWPDDLPDDIAVLRRAPYESRVDSYMYLQALADTGRDRGWHIHRYDARTVEADATAALGTRAEAVLHGPRAALGPPWGKDQRMALAATVLAG
jgi:hypothetical protein